MLLLMSGIRSQIICNNHMLGTRPATTGVTNGLIKESNQKKARSKTGLFFYATRRIRTLTGVTLHAFEASTSTNSAMVAYKEGVGSHSPTVFKTAAISHSANLPDGQGRIRTSSVSYVARDRFRSANPEFLPKRETNPGTCVGHSVCPSRFASRFSSIKEDAPESRSPWGLDSFCVSLSWVLTQAFSMDLTRK